MRVKDPSNKEPKVEIEDHMDESAEQPFQERDFEEFDKEKPLQETQGPGKAQGTEEEGSKTNQRRRRRAFLKGSPFQESASSDVAKLKVAKREARPHSRNHGLAG
ncbi:hypothetical protein OS493_030870 [Desmophyllum pertusum]|uniref:Uncharacterized protein n=1 Tax=Desmophyllum pertusum TaxID=174260 RepID=A0A9X0CD72_9CNID|nr:hypothetical protein OS493_030870 [Desmophyllum pertusum]